MQAIMLAAGRGLRLNGGDGPPKSLLTVAGTTLLRRHVALLQGLGIAGLTLVIGYRAADIEAELTAVGAGPWVRTIVNPRFTEGAVVSLWAARHMLRGGGDILFMDADVLYAPDVLGRLVRSPHRNCFLIDRDLEPGPEPVKICLRGGRIVEFGKNVEGDFEAIGEWPGFLRLDPDMAARLADATERYVESGRHMLPYEPAMRDVLLDPGAGHVGCEDITGMPWIEIDTPDDLRRAREVIAPALALGQTLNT